MDAVRDRITAVVAVLSIVIGACSGGGAPTGSISAGDAAGSAVPSLGDPATDKLAQVLARGRLLLPTDTAYPPASFAVAGAQRATDTHCATDELTAPEVDGYDVATGKLVAQALGVEPCFVTPTWSEMIAGNWNDRWDIAFASIGITRERMNGLFFTRPYYATPERFYVRTSASTGLMEELDGLRIGVCTGCFADLYLQKRLDIPGEQATYRVDNAVIVGYAVERTGLQDVVDGKLDAFLCQETAGQQAIDEGLDLRGLEPAAYVAFPAGAIDRSSGKDVEAFLDQVDGILVARFADGKLKALSERYFGVDYATAAGAFDMAALNQLVD